jgi:hypothetical protein
MIYSYFGERPFIEGTTKRSSRNKNGNQSSRKHGPSGTKIKSVELSPAVLVFFLVLVALNPKLNQSVDQIGIIKP